MQSIHLKMSNWYSLRVTTSEAVTWGIKELSVQLLRAPTPNKLFPFISTASVCPSIYIMILCLYSSAGEPPHCPLLLQMCYHLSLEARVNIRRLCPLWRAATWINRTLCKQISIDSSLNDGRHKLPLCFVIWEETTGKGILQATDIPTHLSFLSTYSSPVPACFSFLMFSLCTSPSWVSLVHCWEWSPHKWTSLSSHFPTNFQHLFLPFPYRLPLWLKVSEADTTEKSAAIQNDRWPFTMLPTCLLRVWY